MRLLYIYVSNNGILNDVQFNFCSDKRFHFNRTDGTLQFTENNANSQKPFFSTSAADTQVYNVESISAVVGDNGAGKTSIAVFLHDLFIFEEQKEHILVCEIENILYCTYAIFPVVQANETDDIIEATSSLSKPHLRTTSLAIVGRLRQKHEVATAAKMAGYEKLSLELKLPAGLQRLSVANMRSKWSLIYSSNFYTQQHLLSSINNIQDLSTSYLIKQDYEKFINESSPRTSVNPIVCHDFYDSYRIIKWLVYCRENDINWQIGKVTSIQIVPFNYDLKLVAQKRVPSSIQDNHNSYELDFSFLSKPKAAESYVCAIFRCFLGNWLRYELNQNHSHSYMLNIYQCIKSNLSSDSAIEDDCIRTIQGIISIGNKHKQDVNSCVHMLELFNLFHCRKCQESLIFDLSNPDEMDRLYRILKIYTLTHTMTHFLTFDLRPALSAGELAQYQLYSRLYDLKVRSELYNNELPRDLIIFFDEIEITIHPKLQRMLVENVIRFCETVYIGHKIHVFFASHSPVLLSDIPSRNVALLSRGINSTTCINGDTMKLRTFGANIHDLYRHSFFLDTGLIGSFATSKIGQIVQSLKDKDIQAKPYIRQLVDMIDEPLMREHLMSKYFRVFEPSDDEEVWLTDRLKKVLQQKAENANQ